MNDHELYEQLSAFITAHKRGLFDRIAPLRTRHIAAVLEDVYQSQNASAVLRTCDLLGVQDIHVIEQHNAYKVDHQVALGSAQWVDIHSYRSQQDNTRACMEALRARGYRIVATSPHSDAYDPHTLPLDRPLAICFGTELTGLSSTMLNEADMHLRIPMYGFTESYNLSVSAAIVLFTLTERLRNSDMEWRLDEEAVLDLKLRWVRNVLQRPDLIEARLREASANNDHHTAG